MTLLAGRLIQFTNVSFRNKQKRKNEKAVNSNYWKKTTKIIIAAMVQFLLTEYTKIMTIITGYGKDSASEADGSSSRCKKKVLE